MLPLIALSGVMAGCSGLPPGAMDPVDCSELPPASPELIRELEAGEIPFMDESLVQGTAQIVITVNNADGLQWYAPPGRSEPGIRLRTATGGTEHFWSVWVNLDCGPPAAVFINFWREDRSAFLEPGDYPLKAVSFDVPDKEQTGDQGAFFVDGFVTITAVGEGSASGYMQGRGGGTLKSNYTQEPLALDYSVEALAFRDFPVP